jgi:type IV pilus assembly protein PilY1
MVSKSFMTRMLNLAVRALFLTTGGLAYAASLSIVDVPLFLSGNVAPLNMLVVGRDHKLFYEAYADHSDLDGDTTLDIGYRGFDLNSDGEFKIDYYGYFDSYKCYAYSGGIFVPQSTNSDKRCSSQWSGDWLNWVTTTRIDALRKVLYGGKRWDDTASRTVLERATIPQDAHSWGKEYTSFAVDGYNISDVTPLSAPAANTRHFFANTTLLLTTSWTTNTAEPLLRVLTDQPSSRRIWNWVSKEAPVAGASMDTGSGNFSVTPTDYIVRVEVCRSAALAEENCRDYPTGTVKKPTGLLQDFGENDAMLFGLLTGSYEKSKSGGVVRKDVGTIKNEINWNTDGTFTNTVGIIKTMDRFRTAGFTNYTNQAGGYGASYQGGLVSDRPFNEGEFGGNWGNPVAEMMYEALRYFAQSSTNAASSIPTSVFDYSGGIDGTAPLSLPKVNTWTNPYRDGQPACAKPFQTVMSDVNTSYDSDQLPGANWGSGLTDTLPGTGLDVEDRGNDIWTNEIGGTGNYFIGESGAISNGAPTPKSVTGFGDIRGLSPEEPTKQGTYYSASVAHYGLTTDLNTVAAGAQKAQTFAVALASPLPRIEIPVGGRTITIVPFAKSVAGCGSTGSGGFPVFQPTNQIVDFYVEALAADRKSGTFQVNFEDVEAGNDHDMDAIARYSYVVNANDTVTITVTSDYAAGCIVQHMGYVVSGSTHDGIYLVVRDRDTATADEVDYFLDAPPAFVDADPPAPASGLGTWDDNIDLPLASIRSFSPGTTASAGVLNDPLWYAAKWGGFKDKNNNNLPDSTPVSEWDEDGNGVPDNYFLVTNALTLGDRLGAAFREIARRQGSASSASVNTGSISSDTRVYQAKFSSGDWTGQLLSFPVVTVDNTATPQNEVGTLGPAEWNGWQQLNALTPTNRVIITTNPSTTGTSAPFPGVATAFRWSSLDATRRTLLQPADPSGLLRGSQRLDYLRGDESREQRNNGRFRNRLIQDPAYPNDPTRLLPNKLGDIVSSSPIYVGAPAFAYPDTLETVKYADFATAQANRQKMVYVGANDGMLHGFDAGTDPTSTTKGRERLAFIPGAVFPNLHELTKPNYPYNHKFFVDGTPTIGDIFVSGSGYWRTVLIGGLNKGGQSIYALDITDPSSFTEANAASIFRWEFSHADLGYTYSRPVISKTRLTGANSWVAIFGNGYNNSTPGTPAPISTTGTASLFIVNAWTGALIRQIDTGVGSVGTPNGLATPAVVDINNDHIADYVYAGDLLGNMWKFDLRSTNSASWSVAYTVASAPAPLYTAKDSSDVGQPITSKPQVSRGPRGVGMMVLFGTGKFMEQSDKSPTQTQTFYGIHDKNTGLVGDIVANRAALTQQTITTEATLTFGGVNVPVRVTTQNAMTNSGWYMDLLSPNTPAFRGEMQVSNSVLRNGRIIFTTLIPDTDPCGLGGTSWLMEMDALSGARLNDPPFDLNNDGLFNTLDQIAVTQTDGTVIYINVSGQQSEVGITPGIGVLFDPGGVKEYKYLSGSTENASGSNLQRIVENPGPNSTGRQSWRQIK